MRREYQVIGPTWVLCQNYPGVVSEGWSWTLFHDCWMYGPVVWWKLPWEVFSGWKKDHNLVG